MAIELATDAAALVRTTGLPASTGDLTASWWQFLTTSPVGATLPLWVLQQLGTDTLDDALFVALGGDDGGTGSIGNPYGTVPYALSQLAPSGLLILRGGVYDVGIVTVPSGTDGAYTRIHAYPGETVWIKPLVHGVGNDGFPLHLYRDEHHIEFDGINFDATLVGGGPCAIASEDGVGDPHHIRIQNAAIVASTDNSALSEWGQIGVGFGGHNATTIIGGNELLHCVVHGGGFPGVDVHGSGYGCYLSGPNNRVEGCEFYGTRNAFVQIYNASGASADHNIVRGNYFHDLTRRSGVGQFWGVIVAGNDNLIADNVFAGMDHGSLISGEAVLAVYYGDGNQFLNNTGFNNNVDGVVLGEAATNTVVRNTLFYGVTGTALVDGGTGTVADHNMFANVDPLFVDSAAGDFRLQAGSAAIGAGVDEGYGTDIGASGIGVGAAVGGAFAGVYVDTGDGHAALLLPGGGSGAAAALPVGHWTRLAVVRSGDTHRVYVDGAQVGTDLTEDTAAWILTAIRLGNDGTRSYGGVLRVTAYREWLAALTLPELEAEWDATTVVRTANLWTDTPLIDDLLDRSGFGHHWTLTGTVVEIPLGATPGVGIAVDSVAVPAGGIYNWNHTCSGTNRRLYVATRGGLTGVTYAGVALREVAWLGLTGAGAGAISTPLKLWLLDAPALGTHDVILVSPVSGAGAVSVSYTGVRQSGAVEAVVTASSGASATTLTTPITVGLAGCWLLVAEFGYAFNIPPTAGAGLVRRGYTAEYASPAIFDSDGVVVSGTPGATTGLFTSAGEPIFHIVVAFAPAYAEVADPPIDALIFDGNIVSIRERGLATRNVATILHEVSALSQYALMDRRHLTAVFDHFTLRQVLTALCTYVPALTVHPLQVEGPEIPELVITVSTVTAVVEQLQVLTGYFCEVRGGYIRMFAPGSVRAPFAILAGDGHCLGDVTVEVMRTADYANQIIVQQEGEAVVVVQDDAEVAAHGLWTAVITVEPEMLAAEKAEAATAYLAQSVARYRQLRYVTETDGLRPGQAQFVSLPTRDVEADFLITDVEVEDARVRTMRYTVTLLEGIVFKPGWRRALRGVLAASGSIITREKPWHD